MTNRLLSRAFDEAETKTSEQFTGQTCSMTAAEGESLCPICYFRVEVRRLLEPLFFYGGPIHHVLRLVAEDTWSASRGREAIVAILSGEEVAMPSIQADTPHIPGDWQARIVE